MGAVANIKVAIIEPVGGHGGMDYYDFGLCRSLTEAGADITLYTCDETGDESAGAFRIVRSFRKIYGGDPAWRRGIRYLRGSLRAMLNAALSGTKICHFHYFQVGPLEFLNVVLARIMSRRVVVTVHDVEPFVDHLSVPALARLSYKLAHHVIVHNRVSRDEMSEKMTLPDHKISVIPHGNYLHMLRPLPPQTEARKRLGIPEDAKVLLFFGQIKEVKGLDLLLWAMPAVLEAHPDTYLLIGGRPWKSDFSIYEKIIDNSGIQANCILHIGYVPNDEVSFYYAASDLVVLPYRRIYQSGVILMALSYGKPVLASDLPGMAEVVTHGKTGLLFKANDAADLSKKTIHAWNNMEELQRLGQAGLKLMEDKYPWEHIGMATKRCYLNVVKGNN